MFESLRWKTVGLFLVLCLVDNISCTQETYRDQIIAQYQRTSALMVLCMNPITGEASPVMGSGVIVSDDTIMTAAHVVDCEGVILVRTGLEQESIATVTKINKERDIAVLNAPGVTGPTLTFGPKPLPGDKLCVSPGWPNRNRNCGEVYYEEGGPGHGIRFSAIVQPGNSGAGVYNTHDQLVGILTILTVCGNSQYCGAGATALDLR